MIPAAEPLLRFKNVSRAYASPEDRSGSLTVLAVQDVSLDLPRGAFAALIGPSGSGKTTLLNLASGLDRPTRGEILISGTRVSALPQRELCHFRRRHLGFVFQAYNLFPALTAVENVEFTSVIRGDPREAARERAVTALRTVGLEAKLHSYPSELSGGQQQRVAVARALATQPDIIFADEPTANLDSKTAIQLIGLFEELNRTLGATFLFSTHDQKLVERVRTPIRLVDGKLA
ncbi:MAG: ABC transporter ATP-binding protein [Oligoflexia bacterium]|nr:ABC transporter ATP-binding protein [Oligoflexia bacterium]